MDFAAPVEAGADVVEVDVRVVLLAVVERGRHDGLPLLQAQLLIWLHLCQLTAVPVCPGLRRMRVGHIKHTELPSHMACKRQDKAYC